MAKNQSGQETATEEPDVWLAEEATDFEDAASEARSALPAKSKLDMRHKIEDLIEARRLKKQIGDYEFLDIDETGAGRAHARGSRRVH